MTNKSLHYTIVKDGSYGLKAMRSSLSRFFWEGVCDASLMMRLILVLIISLRVTNNIFSQSTNARLDVIRYNATLEPELKTKSIEGNVTIVFLSGSSDVVFNSGGLGVSNVVGENVKSYEQRDKKLIVSLMEPSKKEMQVQVFFSGKPTSGLVFPEEGQGYTFFFTSDWLVCNDAPGDKATCTLGLLIPEDKACVASGVLTKKEKKGEKVLYQWNLDFAAPTYTYGFAIGIFNSYRFWFRGIELNHYSKDYSKEKLQKIFNKTGDMIDYFEKRSGVPYPSMAYSQILIGYHYQEMSGFSLLKKSYGDLVLKDTTETNLISHELAHQWWGNQITCDSWNHIWLNEGLATFMSAAYNEHRFGPGKYKADIEAYQNVYRDLVRRGKDKSLVFASWKNATSDDRNLVYFKGAYVLHLLRVELGDEAFWNGIKEYSQQYFGKTVDTFQFQKTMEEVAGRELHTFFDKWVYKKV